jgi:3-oxoacyl-[acyl-carrier protein] reductase
MLGRDEGVRTENVILVTGATGAIGFEIAAQAAAGGAVIGVHGSRQESVDAVMHRLHARIGNAQLISAPADFSNLNAIDDMVRKVAREGSRLDAVIHCGITGPNGIAGAFAQASAENFAAHAAFVLGAFQRLCFAALPHLSQRGGTIVGFASDAGRFAAPRQALIGAAFAGIMGFVRNLALETARTGVRVHCISPSFVENTPIFNLHPARAEAARQRAGLGLPTPEDIAPLALFLCSKGAAKITGQVISINGGMNA